MRIPNEVELAMAVPQIDLMLGGHDHVYHSQVVNDVFFLKSGTDFEEFSDLKITLGCDALPNDPIDDYAQFYSPSKKLLFETERVKIGD
jgi:2',3'-cyclic-nucleotide 2'-phosphodiesterase (5'-nucleotidase family)